MPPGAVSVKLAFDTVVGSTGSENVAETVAFRATLVALSDGLSPVTVGPVVSTVQVREAAVGSVPPAVVARTSKVCAPSASPVPLNGDVQGVNEKAAPSRRQAKVAPGWSEEKVKEADVVRVAPVGPEVAVIVVSGVGTGGPPLKYGSAPMRAKALSEASDESIVQSW